ncbi:keywimysin-related RiPP [Micromonospora sp. NPDC051300]
MAKKSTYQRPTLSKGGSFAQQTAGSLFTNCRESFVTQKPRAVCS